MNKILLVLGATAAYLLYLSGPNEPGWLKYAVFGLLILTVSFLGICLADITSIENDPINAECDEHRDNSI